MPIIRNAGFSQNAYVMNNPINMLDPTGHVPEWVGDNLHAEYISSSEYPEDVAFKVVGYKLTSYSNTYNQRITGIDTYSDREETHFKSTTTESWTYLKRTLKEYNDGTVDRTSEYLNFEDEDVDRWTVIRKAEEISVENQQILISEQGYPPLSNADDISISVDTDIDHDNLSITLKAEFNTEVERSAGAGGGSERVRSGGGGNARVESTTTSHDGGAKIIQNTTESKEKSSNHVSLKDILNAESNSDYYNIINKAKREYQNQEDAITEWDFAKGSADYLLLEDLNTLMDEDATQEEKQLALLFLVNPAKTVKIIPVNKLDELGELVGRNGDEVANHSDDIAKGIDNGYKYWNKTTQFKNVKVYQRDDIINPNMKDTRGRTNLERMQKGLALLGPDGKSINLHHTTQRNESSIAEVTQTFHKDNSSVIHINPNTIPSGINRSEFGKWRTDYWKNRANDF